MAARFEASQQLRYLPNGIFHDTACEDSQCDTIYDDDDEEITEEEESLETDYKNEDDDADDATDDLSTSDADDSETNGDLSFEIQDFINQIPEITEHFQIISKIGEGTFSSVYKAMDLKYHLYYNDWDADWVRHQKYTSPPIKKRRDNGNQYPLKYVALKKIYVTSSPIRILNELELLHDLRGCDRVVSLITAIRNEDQVVAVLPYFKHSDFRDYYRSLSLRDIRLYFLSLFSALKHVHSKGIIHRDIKPSNFLFDISTRQGVLVDFGLAEYQDPSDAERCPCSMAVTSKAQDRIAQAERLTRSTAEGPAYLKHDQRPAKRANRAGTRGFRAPEVLFKCQSQTTKIDIWSCGVILLSFLAKRFPFFNSADDVDAMIEVTSIFGRLNMKTCAKLHNCSFDAPLPTFSDKRIQFQKLVQWATSEMEHPNPEQELALKFLDLCMELNPNKRISATEALRHPFLSDAECDEGLDDDVFLA